MLVHSLSYGMLASKGHAVSIPTKMSIATKLPLLPQEVSLLILRRKTTTSKDYYASRSVVQEALEGLCFGMPKYGECVPMEGFSQYKGKDHVSGMRLNGKWFKYEPNPFYYDVEIMTERLNKIPEKRAFLQGIPLVQLPEEAHEEENENNDLGPAPEQFDKLDATEEITSTSEMVTPINPQKLNEDIRKAMRNLIGDDWEEHLDNIAEVEQTTTDREKPISELNTKGFFTMAYPELFINGSGDWTISNQRKPDFQQWINHIYWTTDARIANHPHLKFHLLNLSLR